MRLFVAARLPDEIEDAIAEFLDQFLKLPGRVKWVEPRNVHITLKFLGETDRQRFDEVRNAINGAIKGHTAFDLTIRDCGAFPNLNRPRVFWIGIDDPERRLRNLAHNLDTAMTAIGFPPDDRPFSPHLTLGRVKEPFDLESLCAAYSKTVFEPISLRVEQIHLIESHLRPTGPIYQDLAKFKL